MTPLYDFDIACSVQTPTQIDLTPIIWIASESNTTYLPTLIDNLLDKILMFEPTNLYFWRIGELLILGQLQSWRFKNT